MIVKFLASEILPAQFKAHHAKRLGRYYAAEVDLPSSASVLNLLVRLRRERPDSNWGIKPAAFSPTALFFDMDATVIGQESLVEMAQLIGVGKRVAEITERAMSGELDFAAALRERVMLLRGQKNDIYERIWPKITVNHGLEKLVRRVKSAGVPSFLVSGGFVQLASRIADQCGFEDFHANNLSEKNGVLTGEIEGVIVDAEEKRRWMLATIKSRSIQTSGLVATGDGANDRLMLEAAGMAVGYQPKPVLRDSIQVQIADGNFEFLEELLCF